MHNRIFFTLLWLITVGLISFGYASESPHVEKSDWQFKGLPAHWDKDQLYRGYTVATQVCMACHSFKYISHRDLMKAGFTEDEAKALASKNNTGLDDKMISGLDAESSITLYGKIVPDLSVINKARAGLADYTYAVLTGYVDDESHEGKEEIHHYFPEGLPDGAYFNKAFPGHAIAMPSPLLMDDQVEYHDETGATIAQMAKDVTYFIQWTAEPELIKRKRMGVYVLIYLFIFTILAFFTKRAIWRDVKH